MKRILNSIFYCLFRLVLIGPVFSEKISLSQDDLTKLQTLLNQSIENNSKNEEKNQNDVIVLTFMDTRPHQHAYFSPITINLTCEDYSTIELS